MTGFVVGADEAELRDRAARLGERIGSTADALLSTTRRPAGSSARPSAPPSSSPPCATPACTA